MVSATVFVTLSMMVAMATAYSGGAPEDVCVDMTPKHSVDPQKSAFPYKITTDHETVKAGDKVKITISGPKPFKGFLLQVRDGKEAVGKFNVDDSDKYVKTINCFSKKQVFHDPLEKHINYMIRQSINLFHSIVNKIFPLKHMFFYNGNKASKHNAATHKNSAEKESLTLEWVAPEAAKSYTVHATVAENGGVFWANHATAKITVQ
ncbi:PREDICTED: putative defense protein Hdd11 isoform X1 [Nicrophorus vespilloides]|uniref:Defense protein Hdd11 isoform X1 n=1 Tax=Nicrophorus vespilloides TaxID=110193 RepID=A0ABM1NCD0_NICVS|nr:PREDICTED: putative defense protein Hdd11 isoform X1 [Nicrophorus vespilloides]